MAILHEEGENNNKDYERMHTPRPSSSSNELYLGSNTFGPPVVSFHSEKTWTTTFWESAVSQQAGQESSTLDAGLRTTHGKSAAKTPISRSAFVNPTFLEVHEIFS